MLNNGNFLGNYDLGTSNWRSGMLDMRSHAGMRAAGLFPEYPVLPTDIATSYAGKVGPYTGKSVSILTQEGSSNAVFVTDDGTKMFLVGIAGDTLWRYNLSTPYDISTASASSSYAFGTTVVDPGGFSISPDGTKLLVLSTSTDIIHSYSMSTPWALSSVTYDSKTFSVTTQEATPAGIYVKPDGTKFWAIGTTADTVFEYTMSTPWDLATAAYASVSLSVTALDTAPGAVCWNSTGTQFFVTGRTNSIVGVYNAPTAWTVTGATLAGRFNFGSIVLNLSNAVTPASYLSTLRCAYLIPGTNYLYVIDSGSDRVVQFENPIADTLSVATNCGYVTNDQSFTLPTETLAGFFWKPDGSRFWVGNSSGIIREYVTTSSFTVTGATLVRVTPRPNIDSTTTVTGAGFSSFFFSADGLNFYGISSVNGYVTHCRLIEPWNLSTAATFRYTGTGIIGSTLGSKITFSKDGTKVFFLVSGTAAFDTVYSRALSTPWDLSTAGTATSKSLATTVSTGYFTGGIVFTEDGRFMYALTNSIATRLFKYEMTTPWDISTLIFQSIAYLESTAALPVNLGLNRTGSQVFLLDRTNYAVYRFSLA